MLFLGSEKYPTAEDLASRIAGVSDCRYVVLTGGEPLLQVDAALISALHARGRLIAVETNGTLEAPAGIDWICVSPKAGQPLRQRSGDELKVVVPQPLDMDELSRLDFKHLFVQPMDGRPGSREWAVDFCIKHEEWRLSVQIHKVLGLR